MYRKTYWRRAVIILAVVTFSLPAQAERSPMDWAFIRLEYARQEKARQLRNFCEKVHEKATLARADSALIEFFDINLKYFRLQRAGETAPEELRRNIAHLHKAMNDHYIRNYLCFYDILFVDADGHVFYTLRKEGDFRNNLLDGEWARSPLGLCLRSNPEEEVFIDFHFYPVSDEPAAFFVEPVRKNGQPLGWLVLQCAINKVNSLFAGFEKLGATGETFLVNQDGYMLSESNFQGDSTILKRRLDDQNIQAKFKEKQGHRTVTDYRGHTALTSFEVVDFLGAQWLVVAKIDEDQILTEHLCQHRQYYHDSIKRHLANAMFVRSDTPESMNQDQKVTKVDMDEFVRADHGELLCTVGVSTCTAVIVSYPSKFGYLAHISPQDHVYGGQGTNLLGSVIKKIKTYDTYKYEMPLVRFVIVARHQDSLSAIVDKLVEEGFLLSQISVLHGPAEHYANVMYDYSQDRIRVEWVSGRSVEAPRVQQAPDGQNLGEIVKQLIAGPNGGPETQMDGGLTQANRNRR